MQEQSISQKRREVSVAVGKVREEILNGNKTDKMCSSGVCEPGKMSFFEGSGTYRDRMLSTSREFIEILSFKHFARYMSFQSVGQKGARKRILNEVDVSVVLHVVSVDTSHNS